MPLPIQKSTSNNCGAADSEISSQTVLLSIQKSAANNCVAADSEISSQTVLLSLIYFFLVVYINPIMAVDKVTICL
jgi:hypothetical protein